MYSKDETLEIMRTRLFFDQSLSSEDVPYELYKSAVKHFGSWTAAKRIIGAPEQKDQTKWTKPACRIHLLKMIRNGEPVNYTAVAQRHTRFLKAVRKLFGGYRELFEDLGLNYDDYRTDTDLASYYGYQFEGIVGEILDELGIPYQRGIKINGCVPDFVTPDGWIDAKLSRWSIAMPDNDTVPRYEKECDALTIIYLRGARKIEKIREKTTVMSVYKLIERLPKEKQAVFIERLEQIESELEKTA